MSAKFALISTLILCIIMLISTLIIGSSVSAQEIPQDDPILGSAPEQSLQGGGPVEGGPGFISVSTWGFKPYHLSSVLSYYNMWLYNGGSSLGAYIAPINLPHGANITKIVLFYYDGTDSDLTLYLLRLNLFDGSSQTVAATGSTGHAGYGFTENSAVYPSINNQLYSYILEVDIPNGFANSLCLINIRIDYSYPAYLPTVMK